MPSVARQRLFEQERPPEQLQPTVPPQPSSWAPQVPAVRAPQTIAGVFGVQVQTFWAQVAADPKLLEPVKPAGAVAQSAFSSHSTQTRAAEQPRFIAAQVERRAGSVSRDGTHWTQRRSAGSQSVPAPQSPSSMQPQPIWDGCTTMMHLLPFAFAVQS